jgi:hypothetical protein
VLKDRQGIETLRDRLFGLRSALLEEAALTQRGRAMTEEKPFDRFLRVHEKNITRAPS